VGQVGNIDRLYLEGGQTNIWYTGYYYAMVDGIRMRLNRYNKDILKLHWIQQFFSSRFNKDLLNLGGKSKRFPNLNFFTLLVYNKAFT
jgi:hypothetical protein